MPKRALPSIFDAASIRRSGLPMIVNCAGSFRSTLRGIGCRAASAVSSPKLAVRPDGCVILPATTLQSTARTSHFAAAALTSIARADAPASRIGVHRSLRLDEPPVVFTPKSRVNLRTIQTARRLISPSSSGRNQRSSTMLCWSL
ncbi:hypothetical protein R69919_02826 [Paraburkholderia gardini]|nr:hypothetical protein R69919_02826 [Paraburkholderia gardini]